MKNNFMEHIWLFEAKQSILSKWEDQQVNKSHSYKPRDQSRIGASYSEILLGKDAPDGSEPEWFLEDNS